jgi:hypothetical protein
MPVDLNGWTITSVVNDHSMAIPKVAPWRHRCRVVLVKSPIRRGLAFPLFRVLGLWPGLRPYLIMGRVVIAVLLPWLNIKL